MAIPNRFSVILLCCDSTHFLLLAGISADSFDSQFLARNFGNRAIRDSRFCAAKLRTLQNPRTQSPESGERLSSLVTLGGHGRITRAGNRCFMPFGPDKSSCPKF